MAGEDDRLTLDGNGWQHERADVMVQLAVLTKTLCKVEAQVERLAEMFGDVQRQQALDEARREIVAELFKDLERMQRETPEKLRERLEELEKLKPLGRAAMWALGIIGALLLTLLWGMMTGQVVVAFK